MRKLFSFGGFLTLMIVAFMFSGCTPTVAIKTPVPSKYNFGSKKQFMLVQMEGRRSLKEELTAALGDKLRATAWWQLSDRLNEGIEIKLMGDTAEVTNAEPKPGEVFFKIEAFEVNADSERIPAQVRNGKVVRPAKTVYNGSALIGVTSVDENKAVKLAEKEYNGKNQDESKDMAKQNALVNAIELLVADITPSYQTQNVQLDEEADDMGPIIEIIKNGAYAQAAEQLEAKIKAQSNRADLVYNLAVVTEAMGNNDEAMGYYNKALSLGGQDFYSKERARLAKRIADLKSLEK
ncbi:MAG: hypothetical protein OEY59_02465 [Deltaproteobacteria bacterium]|nr:hypothetical protein [Deltaproteobacteria bacterium]